ncbi:uncharacterized protein IWZ02DRAFT_486197 [Phyllosticta citriasiana]|uniref:uncharacterized protein n=1 Tax=Phyllosticta citriasiana TaxID=595635 RepID=UPI0030FDBB21
MRCAGWLAGWLAGRPLSHPLLSPSLSPSLPPSFNPSSPSFWVFLQSAKCLLRSNQSGIGLLSWPQFKRAHGWVAGNWTHDANQLRRLCYVYESALRLYFTASVAANCWPWWIWFAFYTCLLGEGLPPSFPFNLTRLRVCLCIFSFL